MLTKLVILISKSQKKREQMREKRTKYATMIKLSVIHFKATYSSAFLSFAGSA